MKQSDMAMKKADQALAQECRRQVMLTYGAAGIALKNKWKFTQDKIIDVFDKTDAIWHEVGDDNKVSMLSLLEEETGIEVQNTDCSCSWHDLNYLNGEMPGYDRITKAQYIFMRNRQRSWMGPMIQACLYLALYRYYDFKPLKLRHLMEEIGEIRHEHGQKEKRITDLCKQVTGINVVNKFTEKRKYG